jgi:CheY-like chemotaxis protein
MIEDGSLPLRILVVDDCEDAAVTLAMLTQMWGHTAWTAFDGPEALRLAATHRPDLVFLDIGMPRMTGWQVAAELRKMDGVSSAYLVVISGYGQERDKAHSHDAGCDLHLLKPVPIDVLRQVISDRQQEKRQYDPGATVASSIQPPKCG